jgi:hypothetical protein
MNYGATQTALGIQSDIPILGSNTEAQTTSGRLVGRQITITPQDYGYLVNVGCQTVCIETKEKLIEKLIAYINNPSETEQKYLAGKLF